MQVQVNTDHNIEGHEALVKHVTSVVEHAMRRSNGHTTRVEVHLSDDHSGKGSHHDMGCVMEARLEGMKPLVVAHHAETVHQAVDGAASKLTAKVDHTLGRLKDQRRNLTDPPLPGTA